MVLSNEEKRALFEEFKQELMKAQKVYVEVCREGVMLPQYSKVGDAGMDIKAAEEVTIAPGETKVIPTGLKMAIPEGYELQVRPRSGLSLKTPLRIANSPGTIDSGYRDEIGILVSNTSVLKLDYNTYMDQYGMTQIVEKKAMNYLIDEKGNKPGIYTIKKGDRIAQIVLVKFETIAFDPVEDVKTFGLNRGGGFGSTGLK